MVLPGPSDPAGHLVLSALSLRDVRYCHSACCYAMCGTDIAYGATSSTSVTGRTRASASEVT
eukprot:204745-Rhodomonas_salina.1